ncbi:hypothetical protein BHE90_003338 [Fusarium euwallaceae]|uniref:Uncharacterized protein n=1 Tax=Fusarium euwallaceae TaxID=1147111 RepID=A0A430M2G4_9HYPO|nr:hypothetical protein BHE90_003338 [Fusarium euwallaceae]
MVPTWYIWTIICVMYRYIQGIENELDEGRRSGVSGTLNPIQEVASWYLLGVISNDEAMASMFSAHYDSALSS